MTLRLVLPWDGILVPAAELDDFVPNDALIYFNVEQLIMLRGLDSS